MEEAERLVAERGKSQLTRPRDSFVTNRPSQAVREGRCEMGDGSPVTDLRASRVRYGGFLHLVNRKECFL